MRISALMICQMLQDDTRFDTWQSRISFLAENGSCWRTLITFAIEGCWTLFGHNLGDIYWLTVIGSCNWKNGCIWLTTTCPKVLIYWKVLSFFILLGFWLGLKCFQISLFEVVHVFKAVSRSPVPAWQVPAVDPISIHRNSCRALCFSQCRNKWPTVPDLHIQNYLKHVRTSPFHSLGSNHFVRMAFLYIVYGCKWTQ